MPGVRVVQAMPRTLLGKWVGGPYNLPVVLEMGSTGAQGKFKCPSGQWGQIDGLMMKGGARIKGTFTDPDNGGSGSYGEKNTVDIVINSDGVSWTASVTRTNGQTERWSGRKPKWRKSSTAQVWYKDKQSWERLLAKSLAKTPEWQEKQRQKLLQDSYDEAERQRQHALLCESASLGVGDPYSGTSATVSSRHRGRTFVAGKSRFARLNNGYFSQPQPLAAVRVERSVLGVAG